VADATPWLPTYFISLGADTAYNKTIPSISTANLQATYDELITAKAIFIRGGDQWDYVRLWKSTKVDSAINYVFQHGGVIAGTSAGAAVLGDVDFSARYGSVYPDEALVDPFVHSMQFEDNFLNLTPNVLFDTHFIERARHGRLIAMLYNRHVSVGKNLIGVGIDDRTAFCVSPDGTAEVMGSGAVSIFTIDSETRFEQTNPGNYTIEKLKCDQLTNGWKYDLINKDITSIPSSAHQVDTLRAWQLPAADFRVTGSDIISEQLMNNFPDFISQVNNGLFVVLSHPGYTNQLTPLIDYLIQHSMNYQIVYLNKADLNDPLDIKSINDATCFVLMGDSLSILALVGDTTNLVGQSFHQKVYIDGTPLFFFGKSGKIAGEVYTDNLDKDIYASYRGRMTNNTGLRIFGDMLVESSVYDNSDYYENKASSPLWGMMRNRKRLGIYLHGNAMVAINCRQKIIKATGTLPPIFVDASKITFVDSSTYRASGSIGPRQVVTMNNLRYGITTNRDYYYLVEEAKFAIEPSVVVDGSFSSNEFVFYSNYPNPFNPSTTIQYTIKRKQFVTLKVYDILGKELLVLVNEEQAPGEYKINFNTQQTLSHNQYTSGIYFYRLSTANYSETKSMVLIK